MESSLTLQSGERGLLFLFQAGSDPDHLELQTYHDPGATRENTGTDIRHDGEKGRELQ